MTIGDRVAAKDAALQTWSIPLQLTDKHVDPECTPNRIVRFQVVNSWKTPYWRKKLHTVPKDVVYRLGVTERQMYPATFYGKPAFVDSVTGQLYVNGKCQSGDAYIVEDGK